MIDFDDAQRLVLGLDPGAHARVLGAPGTGKTMALTAVFARMIARDGWGEGDVLVLAPNRLVAADLRARIEREVDAALGVTPVRTAASLAFAVLSREAALDGREAPRLLTGTAQDEAITEMVEDGFAKGEPVRIAGLVPEMLMSDPFRDELRELWRIADDYAIDPASFAARMDELLAARPGGEQARDRLPVPELLERWRDAFRLLSRVRGELAAHRSTELSSSALLRRAADAVRDRGAVGAEPSGEAAVPVPRLILIDDAHELGEGQLALVAACASAGSRVWAFGDPDLATGTFQGERTAVMAQLKAELRRVDDARGPSARRSGADPPEQLVVLRTVHRHGAAVRGLVGELAQRVGAAGAGAQRRVEGSVPEPGIVRFATAGSAAEQLGIIAHRLRARRLGVDGDAPTAWRDMAVVCRSRAEAVRVSRALAVHQVPTGIAAGGVVLREHQIVRELVLLVQFGLGLRDFTAGDVMQLVGGVIGGMDPVAIRRLRGALLLHERRASAEEDRTPREVDLVVLEAFADTVGGPIVDSPGGRALRRVGIIAQAGVAAREAGGTARETLWAIWNATRLAERWQNAALEGRGGRADEAHRSLDAVLGLFFALQRHEEQDSEQPIAELLDELLQSTVPSDTLAQRSLADTVTVTTPQGTIGREYALVALIGLQDGAWPNLRARGALLGAAALERWLRGGPAEPPSRRDTIHDELRLLVHSVSRAREELLVVAVSDENEHPSPFFRLGGGYQVEQMPSSRLTLRGATAEMRRRLVADAEDRVARDSLVALAREDVPGAHPDDWYGVRAPSTDSPRIDLAADAETTVPVSPSQLEKAETCPLDWAISSLGGGSGGLQASMGTLVHRALEVADGTDPETLMETVLREWHKLPFDAEWQSEKAQRTARRMVENLAAYLREFDGSGRTLVGSEARFAIPIGRAVLRGSADRLELTVRDDGVAEVTVLDLKTGRNAPSKAAAEAHSQLQAYQLGIDTGAFEYADAETGESVQGDVVSGGARLLYVHPDAAKSHDYVERVQQPITDEAKEQLMQRVTDIAVVMAAGRYEARVEHHCSDPHQPGECRLHIIPAVSHA